MRDMNLSFEDELTFSPKLNSLSLKLASSNRTSIMERSPKEKEDGLDSSFTFQPVVGSNSSKIVAKLKTGFWERQKLHVKRQKQKIEQGPSTIHSDHKRNSSKDLNEPHPPTSKQDITNSYSDDTCLKKKQQKLIKKSSSPYTKSLDGLSSFKEKRKELSQELAAFRKKYTKSKSPNKTITQDTAINRTDKLDTLSGNIDSDSPTTSSKTNIVVVSPCKATKSCSPPPMRSKSPNNYMTSTKSKDMKLASDDITPLHPRSGTFPPAGAVVSYRTRTDRMDFEHQRMIRTKKLASEALKGKKVFVCNGPYSVLRNALRKRGWIEKYFKNVPACCNEENDEINTEEGEMENARNTSDENHDEVTEDEGEQEMTAVESQGDFEKVFSSDSQYGIMSRIVRNFSPTLIWTLRRDDIMFRLLHKEQIVNHFTSAWTFTTKTGLCVNLRNMSSFDSKDWKSFFPRCYRLGCEEERADFIDDYRLTMVQSLLKIIIEKHEEWRMIEIDNEQLKQDMQNKCYEDCLKSNGSSPVPPRRSKPRLSPTQVSTILPSNVISLVLRKCYEYLDYRCHRDLDVMDDYGERCMEELHWTTILNNYNMIIESNAIIANAHQHVEECHELLIEMEKYCPQLTIDGFLNIWILKPGAKSRGRGIEVKNNFHEILKTVGSSVSLKENKWVVQKYIERPFLVYRTKFDIRQWFLVTDWNPLVIWFYQDCYVRFCSQEFTLDKFDPQVHLSNNSIQKHYRNGIRSDKLPDSNMWSSDEFKTYLQTIGKDTSWDSKIYPGMKSAIIGALQCCQTSLEYRRNSFELYGADFMLSENLDPWLIEINSSPALGASTPVTKELCRNVIEDTLKVVLDRRENKQADVGRFELAFRQPYIAPPSYMGCNVYIEGKQISKPKVAKAPEPKIELKKSDDNCDDTGKEEEESMVAVRTDIKKVKSKETCENVKTKTTKSAPKFVYEKKEPQRIDKTRLDGIIEKLSRRSKETKEKIEIIEKAKSSFVAPRIEKQSMKQIEKSVSAPKLIDRDPREKLSINSHRITTCKDELKINVTKPHSEKRKMKWDKMEFLRKNAPVVTEWVNVDFSKADVLGPTISSCPTTKHTQTYSIPSNNINNNTMTISIAEVMENQTIKPSLSTNCGKINRRKSVGKNDSFEPVVSQQVSQLVNCYSGVQVQPNDSTFDVLCPQVGSYDFRVLQQKCHQAYRLKKTKNKQKSNMTSSTKLASNMGTRSKQYGILDAEDVSGVRQVQGKYRQLFLNPNQKENVQHLRLEPSSNKQENEET
ncbi:protein monoglycylase TTLL8-like [Clytia hemisphaerica]|uniref:ATP-grasp domain-containing protein n=1 Tax=Clytia hemisphaerica TaxID=252671 RepID=A0A7M5X5R4_9CNID